MALEEEGMPSLSPSFLQAPTGRTRAAILDGVGPRVEAASTREEAFVLTGPAASKPALDCLHSCEQ